MKGGGRERRKGWRERWGEIAVDGGRDRGRGKMQSR